MKKILQAAALILLAALFVFAAAISHPDSEEVCRREWLSAVGSQQSAVGSQKHKEVRQTTVSNPRREVADLLRYR